MSFSIKWLSLDHPKELYLRQLPHLISKVHLVPAWRVFGVAGGNLGAQRGGLLWCQRPEKLQGDQLERSGCVPKPTFQTPQPPNWVPCLLPHSSPQAPAYVLISPMSKGLPEDRHSGLTASGHWTAGGQAGLSLCLFPSSALHRNPSGALLQQRKP